MEKLVLELKPVGTRMEADRDQFGLALKTWRLRQRKTQKEAGEAIGVSRYTIMKAEAGKEVSWENLYRIFAYLSDALREE